ncbi:MAG: hypothetical protein DKT66_10180 [Candidatus Melainabacteria bacterium]|nr:MAG: hypothetical protein DKT66_10180 [Candidatus Melainabacteria bacterium]
MSERAELLAEQAAIVEQLEDLEFELFAVLSGHDIPRENELKAQIKAETSKLEDVRLRLRNLEDFAPLTVDDIKTMDSSRVEQLFDEIVLSLR